MRDNRNRALAIPLWRGQGEDFERKEHKDRKTQSFIFLVAL